MAELLLKYLKYNAKHKIRLENKGNIRYNENFNNSNTFFLFDIVIPENLLQGFLRGT